jgi:hypothetical protein
MVSFVNGSRGNAGCHQKARRSVGQNPKVDTITSGIVGRIGGIFKR